MLKHCTISRATIDLAWSNLLTGFLFTGKIKLELEKLPYIETAADAENVIEVT